MLQLNASLLFLCSLNFSLPLLVEGFSSSAHAGVFSSSARTLLFLCSNASLPLLTLVSSLPLLLLNSLPIVSEKVKGHLLKLSGRGIKACAGIRPSKLEELKKLDCEATLNEERYYSYDWLSKDPRRVPPHQDSELTVEKTKCLKRYFPNSEDKRKVNIEFANFSDGREVFEEIDSLNDRSVMDAKTWWLVHGVHGPILQKIALKLLGQPSSSSCCERNWSTYSFIHSVRRNKMKSIRAEDLVDVHTNLRLLS
ncbi:uncharacterized protein G2W53_040729 [Senna tora]|uniref:HAT C-terminal dimerisation domain-containing protein n=1 Tax=Senna tora TaxID=362788 RepID=A0A834VXF2_9FABA|nr:uncharacterized protein G2W53_040729 [Senna tora]